MTKLDISLLSGLRQDTLRDFQQQGITTLHQIAAMQPHELCRFKGIKSTAEGFHAQARAWVQQQPIWYNCLPKIALEAGWMFDLETIPQEGNQPWSIGWGTRGTVSIVVVTPTAPRQQLTLPNGQSITLVPDSDTAWQVFAQAVSTDQQPIFHWTSFDAAILRSTAPKVVIQALQNRLCDLHAIFKNSVKLPAESNSLKTVARYFGFQWSGYEDWFAAYRDYQAWLQTRDARKLAAACGYQGDDVLALEIVWQWLNQNAPRDEDNFTI